MYVFFKKHRWWVFIELSKPLRIFFILPVPAWDLGCYTNDFKISSQDQAIYNYRLQVLCLFGYKLLKQYLFRTKWTSVYIFIYLILPKYKTYFLHLTAGAVTAMLSAYSEVGAVLAKILPLWCQKATENTACYYCVHLRSAAS